LLVGGHIHRWATLGPTAGIEGSGTGLDNLLGVWVCTGQYSHKPLASIGALGVAIQSCNHGGLAQGLAKLSLCLCLNILLSFAEGA
jgi:hypothetical protein